MDAFTRAVLTLSGAWMVGLGLIALVTFGVKWADEGADGEQFFMAPAIVGTLVVLGGLMAYAGVTG